MKHFPYIGSGPYCYANSFAMMFGDCAPSTAVIEFATGSPFGMQLVGGRLPFFDPYGWTPEAGFDKALEAMGWESDVSTGGNESGALHRLKMALRNGPVWIGPVEMGHLRHQPGMSGPIGADHYLVVLDVREDRVEMHDPQGFPYASLPLSDFMAGWRAETLDYGTPYTMRTNFRQVRQVKEEGIIRSSLPAAIEWLSMETAQKVPEGSLGNADAALRLAALIEEGGSDDLRDHLIHFAVRVGVRRLSDAATCLARVGNTEASLVMARQARLVGSLQYPLVIRDSQTAAKSIRRLAETYIELGTALSQ